MYAGTNSKPSWDIRMLYDGDCPLCMREVDFLKSRDAGKGKIDFVDISGPSYSPADNQGITFEQVRLLMKPAIIIKRTNHEQ